MCDEIDEGTASGFQGRGEEFIHRKGMAVHVKPPWILITMDGILGLLHIGSEHII